MVRVRVRVFVLCGQLLTDGLKLRSGNHLHARAEVGLFEHCLTTDLLNHLVFIQKVFMKVRAAVDLAVACGSVRTGCVPDSHIK